MWAADMTQHRIVVRVAPDGAIHAETKGVTGEQCLDYVEVLEDLLDAQAFQSSFTDEYRQVSTVSEREVARELRQE